MSRFNAYQNNLPPGCTDADGGASDIYRCSKCDRVISEDEIDDAESEAFNFVCNECAAKMEEEDGPSESALRAEREATGDLPCQ